MPYQKIDEKTGEVYLTRKAHFIHKYDFKPQESTALPCGKCIGCRCDQANEWATRAVLEATKWAQNCFITLTYDENHINAKKTLIKADFQKFIKKLRKHLGTDHHIKYILAGEYGSRTLRPHGHAIIYNYFPPDAKFYKKNKVKDNLYTSDELNRIWRNGFVIVGQCTYESAAYVARYTMKKAYDSDEFNKKRGVEPEFRLTSRRPAIAKPTEKEIAKFSNLENIPIPTKKGIKLCKIPNYLKEFVKKYDRYKYFELSSKKTLESQKNFSDNVLSRTDLTYGWYQNLIKRVKSETLKRLDKRELC